MNGKNPDFMSSAATPKPSPFGLPLSWFWIVLAYGVVPFAVVFFYAFQWLDWANKRLVNRANHNLDRWKAFVDS